MKPLIALFCVAALLFVVMPENGNAQIIKKPKVLKKGKSILKNLVEEEEEEEEVAQERSSDDRTTRAGSGKKMSPPDVNENIDEALTSVNANDYSNSRFFTEQALVGVELELGHKVLESMPDQVLGINYDEEEDQVISTGAGFIGLDIKREYPGSDGIIEAMIANNAAIFGPYNMALSSPSMVAQDENMKVTRVQGHRAVLELDEYDGFKLAVPFGQSSIFILECEVCQDEDEVMAAADNFDIDGFLELLGETVTEETTTTSSGDPGGNLSRAKSSYNQGKYEDSRFELEQALGELDVLLGKEILKLLPEEMGGLSANIDDDDITGSASLVGLYVSRSYGPDEGQSIDITIANNSPMLAMTNAFLNNPLLSTAAAANSGQKRINVHGYKGMLQKDEDESDGVNYEIMVPFGDSLFTFDTIGFDSESDVVNMVNTVPLDKIVKLVQ